MRALLALLAALAPVSAPPPAVTGTFVVGQTLTANPAGEWLRCRSGRCRRIATGATYTLTEGDAEPALLFVRATIDGVPVDSAPFSATSLADAGFARLPGVLTTPGSELRRRRAYTTIFDAPGPGRITIRWTSGTTPLASGATACVQAGPCLVRVALTRNGRRAIKRQRRIPVIVTAAYRGESEDEATTL